MGQDHVRLRLGLTLALSIGLHGVVLTQLKPHSGARSAGSLVLTDVEYLQDTAPVYESASPRHSRIARKPAAPVRIHSEAPLHTQEVPASVPASPSNNSALTSDDQGFLPFYAVECIPRFQTQITPHYPESAQKMGRTAKVILEAYIGPDGRVRKVRIVTSGGAAFDQAALAALTQSTFTPATLNGLPVPVKLLVPYVFSLES